MKELSWGEILLIVLVGLWVALGMDPLGALIGS